MARLTEEIKNKNTGDVLGYRVRNGVSYMRAFNKLGMLEDIEEKDRTCGWFTGDCLPDDGAAVLATVYHRPWIADMGTEDEVKHDGRYEVCQVWRDGDMYIKMDDKNPDLIVFIPLAEQEEDIEYPIEEVVAWAPLPLPYGTVNVVRTDVARYVKSK